ncbi:lytic transglycosylase domain-containing protein [Curtobacterium aurantiacum]|uniref:aggregation-promoting factor C-terminal-like domain-containing protein n=1 Tax=Curtobacterium aurantiacum TaxID=3236919 RepID=UPI0027DE4238|nr:lytic transglycosylase domain-containing protein [Curtobacterium flaccumfaciens]
MGRHAALPPASGCPPVRRAPGPMLPPPLPPTRPAAVAAPVRTVPSVRRRAAATLAFTAPMVLLATQLTLPAFADLDAVAVPGVAAPAADPQVFAVASVTTPVVDRDDFAVEAPTPKPRRAAQQSLAEAAIGAPAVPAATPGSAQAIAAQMVAARGWGAGEYGCLVSLWNKESGWRTTAANPNGAYGIPQAYPGSKMASAGADWQTNPATQITWGLDYIGGRYGTPCGAWGQSQATGAY